MGTVPRSSIPSIASEMQGLRIEDKTEKALMVRVGVLIDALVEAQRGLGNPGQGSRRANKTNLKKPKKLTGDTENLFNAVAITTDPTSTSSNQSHQEMQIDTDSAFGSPTQKQVFANNTTFKGLVASSTYNIRVRSVTKDGQVSDWAILDPVTTTSATGTADIDGDNLEATVESKSFTVSTASQQFFCGTALGFRQIVATDFVAPTLATEVQVEIKDRINVASAGYVDVEEIVFPGFAGSAMTGGAGGVAFQMTMSRTNPIIFFTLVTPTVVTYPATATLDVQISSADAAYAASTEDTVWVEF